MWAFLYNCYKSLCSWVSEGMEAAPRVFNSDSQCSLSSLDGATRERRAICWPREECITSDSAGRSRMLSGMSCVERREMGIGCCRTTSCEPCVHKNPRREVSWEVQSVCWLTNLSGLGHQQQVRQQNKVKICHHFPPGVQLLEVASEVKMPSGRSQ